MLTDEVIKGLDFWRTIRQTRQMEQTILATMTTLKDNGRILEYSFLLKKFQDGGVGEKMRGVM